MRLILFILFLFCQCTVPKSSQQNPAVVKTFDKQGHRGCRGLMPENTIPAMEKALSLGVTTLEMDVVITADRQVVLSHEPFFNHEISTKPDGSAVTESEEKSLNIFRMNYAEVKRFDVGLKPHPRFPRQVKMAAFKPLLSDVFDSVQHLMRLARRPPVMFNIETKSQPLTDGMYHPGPEEFVELLMQVVRSKGMEDRVTIQSFDFRTLQYLHRKYPHMKTAALVEDFDKRPLPQILSALNFTPTIYSPHYSLVNQDLVKECHARNIQIIPWTVNKKDQIKSLTDLGVDGIITDYPDLF